MQRILDDLEDRGHVEQDEAGRYRLTPEGERKFGRAMRALGPLDLLVDFDEAAAA
jgi:DNA-binding IclR family transcriptional regulator